MHTFLSNYRNVRLTDTAPIAATHNGIAYAGTRSTTPTGQPNPLHAEVPLTPSITVAASTMT
ncbi:MAG: hypothetical protein M3R43_12425 [Acidobacteriota bacterium]|nr:hypothetical protein [Acidobacteriota bacterium]